MSNIEHDFREVAEVRSVLGRCQGDHMVEIYTVVGRAVHTITTPGASISVPNAVDAAAAELGVVLTDEERRKTIEAARDASGPELFRRVLEEPEGER